MLHLLYRRAGKCYILCNINFNKYVLREAEWLFSTSNGRKALTKMTKYNRLAIVILYRKQIYESLEAIQNEIGDAVKNLAPSKMKDKVVSTSKINLKINF